MKYKKARKKLKETMDPVRYRHTKGVIKTAKHLAEIYGADVRQVRMAALLHDCAKQIGDPEKIELCRKYGVEVNETELKNPSLLHAKCGAILAREQYGIQDEEILHAIRVHTTGVPEMNLLDKIIFIADYIEPGRDKAPHLNSLRRQAETDLDGTAYRILKDTVEYLNKRSVQAMDPTTLAAYQYYAKLRKGKKV